VKILYRDNDYIAVYKETGQFVHPSNEDATIKSCLMKDLRDHIEQYVYPIHRLDRPVSGIVLFGLNPGAVKNIQKIWHSEKVRKFYLALSRGKFNKDGVFNSSLFDRNKLKKEALTRFNPLNLYQSATLVEVEILTGRYHQIRRHFAKNVDHLLGDRTYGKKKYNDYYKEHFKLERIFLHAHRIEFVQPQTLKSVKIHCPLAPDLMQCLELLSKEHLETIRTSEYITTHYG
jgi:tRNA pseudouridine65 synthase